MQDSVSLRVASGCHGLQPGGRQRSPVSGAFQGAGRPWWVVEWQEGSAAQQPADTGSLPQTELFGHQRRG